MKCATSDIAVDKYIIALQPVSTARTTEWQGWKGPLGFMDSGPLLLQVPNSSSLWGLSATLNYNPNYSQQHFSRRTQGPACQCHFKTQIPRGNMLSASSAGPLSLAGCRALGKPSLDHTLGWDPVIGPSRLHSTAAPVPPAHSRPVHQPGARVVPNRTAAHRWGAGTLGWPAGEQRSARQLPP